jgi:hypothetical protein
LLVVGFGMGNSQGIAPCGDLTEKPQRIGLALAFSLLMGALKGTLGDCKRVLREIASLNQVT